MRDKITIAVVNRVTTKQALEAMRKASSLGSTGMPDKLADCRTPRRRHRAAHRRGRLGRRAGQGRPQQRVQAVLPIRGKIVNAGKATLKQVLENAEAEAIFTAMGAGSGNDFDLADAATAGS